MSDRAINPAVERIVQEWLSLNQQLLQRVFEEVAAGVAPLIADEVVKSLSAALTPSNNQQEVMRLKCASMSAVDFLSDYISHDELLSESKAKRIRAELISAVGEDVPFNYQAIVSAKQPHLDEPERLARNEGGES